MPPHRRGLWSQEEDSSLLRLVDSQGAHNWIRISQLIKSRTSKQCRERYNHNLKPTLNHEPITPEEGKLIEKLVEEKGKQWAKIARRLQGRSDNAVKNWWNSKRDRQRRLCIRRGDTSQSGAAFGERTEQLSFARPVDGYERSLVTAAVSPPRRTIEPLSSASIAYEDSGTDFADSVPLLVDSASSFSLSPRISELQPLVNSHTESRSSLPIFHVGANMWFLGFPVSGEHVMQLEVGANTWYLGFPVSGEHAMQQLGVGREGLGPQTLWQFSGPQPSSPTENLLPLLRGSDQMESPDTRMTLSSILG